jgi:hypothetical protein
MLSKDVETANVKVKELADKITAVVASLKEKKFPETFATELGALNIPFDGDKLGGKGIGSYDGPTLKLLLAYTSDIEALNDRKDALKNLFSGQKTKIVQALQSNEKPLIGYTLLVIKTPKGNAVGSLAPITEPFGLDSDWPKEFKMKNTASGEVQTVTRYESSDPTSTKDKRFGIPVEPSSLSAAFPNDITGKILGEVIKTGELLNGTGGEDGSPGLLKNGEALVVALKKIAAKLAGQAARERAPSGPPLGALLVVGPGSGTVHLTGAFTVRVRVCGSDQAGPGPTITCRGKRSGHGLGRRATPPHEPGHQGEPGCGSGACGPKAGHAPWLPPGPP